MTTSCAQSEEQYRQTEARMMEDWNPEKAEQEQMKDWRIPGWLNAPEWANWIRFCKDRGWVFTQEEPHVYSDGVMAPEGNFVRACEVPGVLFFANRNRTVGEQAPFWVSDRRAGKTVEAEPAKPSHKAPPRRQKLGP